jgi:hypothetical protein
MRDRTWKARRDKIIKEELAQPEHWWWLSFADESGFLGAVLTRAHGFVTAVTKTHMLGVNPGGEVRGMEIPDEVIDSSLYNHKQYADQLLSKQVIGCAGWGGGGS